MRLFLYSTISGENRRKIDESLKIFLHKEKLEVYENFQELSKRLKQPVQGGSIGILAPGTRQEILEILARRHLFRDLKTIIIVPDDEPETISLAHQMRPRFVTYLNGDFGDLAAVISKMVSGRGSNEG